MRCIRVNIREYDENSLLKGMGLTNIELKQLG